METEVKTEKPVEKEFDFSSTATDNFAKILKALNISLAVTSYQSTRLGLKYK